MSRRGAVVFNGERCFNGERTLSHGRIPYPLARAGTHRRRAWRGHHARAGAGRVAFAHVTAQPDDAAQGSYAKISFRVPTESATAGTVKLAVTLRRTIRSPRCAPARSRLDGAGRQSAAQPARRVPRHAHDRGAAHHHLDRAAGHPDRPYRVRRLRRVDGPAARRRRPLVFPAVQTYDDGKVISWDQPSVPGGPEPEHPAPTVRLVAAGGGHQSTAIGVDNTARWLGGIGLALGALGIGLGIGAVARVRQSDGVAEMNRSGIGCWGVNCWSGRWPGSRCCWAPARRSRTTC